MEILKKNDYVYKYFVGLVSSVRKKVSLKALCGKKFLTELTENTEEEKTEDIGFVNE